MSLAVRRSVNLAMASAGLQAAVSDAFEPGHMTGTTSCTPRTRGCQSFPQADPVDGTNRQERQKTEILAAVSGGRVAHALDLAFEHLHEYGWDPVLVEALSRAVAECQEPGLSAQLAALLHRLDSRRAFNTPKAHPL